MAGRYIIANEEISNQLIPVKLIQIDCEGIMEITTNELFVKILRTAIK